MVSDSLSHVSRLFFPLALVLLGRLPKAVARGLADAHMAWDHVARPPEPLAGRRDRGGRG